MPSKKITEFQTLTTVTTGNVLFPVVTDPNGTPQNKKVSLDALMANLPSNTVFKGKATFSANVLIQSSNTTLTANLNVTGKTSLKSLTVANNSLVLKWPFTPASANVSGYTQGTMGWDSNYLYVRTSNTTFKRISLSSF